MEHSVIDTSAADTCPPFDSTQFWRVFHRETTTVNGVRLHFVEGGRGEPVLLLPGWPQSWYAWRYVMPLLAEAGRRVIAVDPRGMGDSDRAVAGYDMRTAAADIHGLAQALALTSSGPIDVVGHDIGSWIGYAYAAEWPREVRRLAVFDSALPGVTPLAPARIPSEEANVKTWHFGFNRLDDLPEILLRGREREFLTWLFRAKALRDWTITPADLDEYVRVNALPGATRSALSYYRHVFSVEGLEQNRRRAETRLEIPVLAFGADRGVGSMLFDTIRMVAHDVRGGVFNDCGHYMPEEAPRAVANRVLAFLEA
ncbi:alpha/beta fold hydrolase [Trinickia diaoshuihuensis]|uniref:alpha/beta fold hydrolase n=1 Tax=Trinickia diaoshuihuensis TaxID=2292265 RepID=UPI000E228A9C|nr:alpha/beta hydrolase [Trinickia diaoshuihuensis]